MTRELRADARATFEAAAPDLLRYFERRVSPREDAADLLADTLMTAWRRITDLPGAEEGRRRWLFGIAAHHLANYRRGVVRRSGLTARLRAALVTQPPPDLAEVQAVRDAVERLPEPQRELVTLVHWEGLTLADAAQLLGVNASTARSRFAAAREALRAALGDPGPDGEPAPPRRGRPTLLLSRAPTAP